jgi:hypothetical protein
VKYIIWVSHCARGSRDSQLPLGRLRVFPRCTATKSSVVGNSLIWDAVRTGIWASGELIRYLTPGEQAPIDKGRALRTRPTEDVGSTTRECNSNSGGHNSECEDLGCRAHHGISGLGAAGSAMIRPCLAEPRQQGFRTTDQTE